VPNRSATPDGIGSFAARASRAGIIVAPLALTGCDLAVLDPKGYIGASNETILIDSVAIMLAIVVPTILATLVFAWWFRASNTRAVYLPEFEYSGRIEMIVWGIPLLVIMLLGGVAWIGSHELDPAEPLPSSTPPLQIQGVSLDWKWLFIYPDQHVAAVNQLVIPVGVPIRFSLSSGSVMTAFFVPQLGSMIYTMNGMVTRLNLSADADGTFLGEASHFSGDGFSDMHFDVRAVPPDQFAAWVKSTQSNGQTLDTAHYTTLQKQGVLTAPMMFGAVEPSLFDQIVSQKLPPGPGPETGSPNPSVSPRTGK
jgi:cytochrome o ubiquinol oxidase subunit II